MNKLIKPTLLAPLFIATLASTNVVAEEKEYQDMSDPMAVYTQFGAGITDKGINLKIGQAYDTGSVTTMGMNIVEFKGIAGESFDIRDSDEALYGNVDNSIDTIRFRNFSIDMESGLGTQVDATINYDKNTLDAAYSLMGSLPKMGFMQLYPLAGVGVSFENDDEHGYQIPGVYAAAGFYGKFTITENIWLNYNPLWLTTISGSDEYKDGYFGNDSNIFTHEFIASYQINPRANIRYFANWNPEVDFSDGDHRIEFNYQF